MQRNLWLLVIALILICGCSESVLIRSYPEGARIFINDTPYGTTPAVFKVNKGDLENQYMLRVEKDGYEPHLTTLRTRVAPGRVVAAFFTLGTVYLYKSPRYIVQPPQIELQPSHEADFDRRVGAELRTIDRLHREGKISDEQRDRWQKDLLEEEPSK